MADAAARRVRFELQKLKLAPTDPDHTNDTAYAMSLVEMSTALRKFDGAPLLAGASFDGRAPFTSNMALLQVAYEQARSRIGIQRADADC